MLSTHVYIYALTESFSWDSAKKAGLKIASTYGTHWLVNSVVSLENKA